MKKILIFTMILCLLLSMVSAQTMLGIQDGKIQGESTYKPSFLDVLFSNQPFDFVGTSGSVNNLVNSVCTAQSTSATFGKLGGESKTSGNSCSVGQYISFIASGDSSDGTIKSGQFLFDKLWYKSSSTDLVYWTRQYLNPKAFNYYYICYSCTSVSTTSTEEGCLSKDQKTCVTQSDSSCGTWYSYQSVCLTHVSSSGGNGGVPSTPVTPTPAPTPVPTTTETCYYCDSSNQLVSVINQASCGTGFSTTALDCKATPNPNPEPVVNYLTPVNITIGLIFLLLIIGFLALRKKRK